MTILSLPSSLHPSLPSSVLDLHWRRRWITLSLMCDLTTPTCHAPYLGTPCTSTAATNLTTPTNCDCVLYNRWLILRQTPPAVIEHQLYSCLVWTWVPEIYIIILIITIILFGRFCWISILSCCFFLVLITCCISDVVFGSRPKV